MPATRRSRDDPSVVGTVSVWPTVTPRRSASAGGQDRAAAGVDGRQRCRPVARHEREPAVGGHVRADDRGGVGPRPVEGDVERGDRADPGQVRHRCRDVPDDPLVRGDRTDRRQDELARDDVGDPAGRGRPGVLADPAQGDDHRQPDGQATQRQRRPARVAVDRAPGKPLLDPQQQRERRAGDPGHDRQQERDEERADQEDGVDQEGLPDAAGPGRSRQDEDPDEGDRDEDRGQPAQACRARRGQVEPRLERLDRLDPAGASGGLEGGRERHADADEQGDGHDVERHGRAVQRDRSDGPDEGDHGHRQEHAEHEAEEGADDAEHQRLGEHVAHDLAPPGPRRAQEADLAEPLRDGHRQRVEDQERSGEQRDCGDETGRGLEVGGRRTQRGGEVLWRGQHVRLGDQARSRAPPRRPPRSAPGARPMSTRLTPASPKTACAVRSGTTTVRPNAPVSGPSPAMMPMTR